MSRSVLDPPAVDQYGWRRVLGVWAAAALPMGLLAWVVAPLLADRLDGPSALPRALIVALTVGLAWQMVLVLLLVHRERGSVRWSVLRAALWLGPPRSPRTGRVGGRVWWMVLPFLLLSALAQELPSPPAVESHDLGSFLGSDAGGDLLAGSWGWFALLAVMLLLNTVFGEELLFRGLLLPRMQAAFGRGDWAVNGLLFAAYHLHAPWAMPGALVDMITLSYASRRYRSAWMGIIVHSAQTVVILGIALAVVLG
ncbi:CPBP family intramembrane glutamic endopeptidase [Nocardioides sp. YIM 152588]|uniref:CPBP family intramembrane glutamic endopeptidase n=1 Tax=Nocardioides sp. YIM 152588 TaxID=3158259 RepID=UPI0032E50BF5